MNSKQRSIMARRQQRDFANAKDPRCGLTVRIRLSALRNLEARATRLKQPVARCAALVLESIFKDGNQILVLPNTAKEVAEQQIEPVVEPVVEESETTKIFRASCRAAEEKYRREQEAKAARVPEPRVEIVKPVAAPVIVPVVEVAPPVPEKRGACGVCLQWNCVCKTIGRDVVGPLVVKEMR